MIVDIYDSPIITEGKIKYFGINLKKKCVQRILFSNKIFF